jgi:hypothetical protein
VRVVAAAATSPLVGRVAATEKVAPANREVAQEVGLRELAAAQEVALPGLAAAE